VNDFLQFLVAGVALGAVYALVSIGFVTVYKATGVLNFAQGGFVCSAPTSRARSA
jgi:branched-chain amino acid transport system permease protein